MTLDLNRFLRGSSQDVAGVVGKFSCGEVAHCVLLLHKLAVLAKMGKVKKCYAINAARRGARGHRSVKQIAPAKVPSSGTYVPPILLLGCDVHPAGQPNTGAAGCQCKAHFQPAIVVLCRG
jgi:hypothetical protein